MFYQTEIQSRKKKLKYFMGKNAAWRRFLLHLVPACQSYFHKESGLIIVVLAFELVRSDLILASVKEND